MRTEKILEHYDSYAQSRDSFRQKNRYYYKTLLEQYRYFVPEGKKVLEIGCGTGDLLSDLKPSLGVGIDVSPKMIERAKQKYNQLEFFVGTVDDVNVTEKFDYVILAGLLGEIDDIQGFLESLQRFCTNDTRIFIEYYSYLWQVILKAGEKLGRKMPQLEQNWLTSGDIINFLDLAGYQFINTERSILLPFNIWGVSYIVNRFIAKLPIINLFTLNHFIVARPMRAVNKDFSVTILIPCRNEKGNIEQAITRTPKFGTEQEFIFVEGWSKDGTYEEVERIIKKFPEKNIKLFKQSGKGKGDAVRFGFNAAANEVLMILDADLTVSPEDLPKFYEAIRSNKGEFINGSRLVYPMEDEAMRFLNLVANKLFGIFFSWLLKQRFKDTLCGTKVMFKHHYTKLAANRHYFGDFDPFGDFDLIFGAVKLNLKAIELPIRYKNRLYGTTQIQRFRHGLLLIRMCWFALWKIRFK
ncbi:MAG: glycosyltransferase [Candidatus Omnitrophica bacterium]|nr:glycosyltransferase [Candidatus Omnitrophota bacterium]